MLEVLLEVLFTLFAIRAIWKLLQGVIEGLSGPPSSHPRGTRQAPSSGPPAHGVQMARDPVCGTYVVPQHALSISDGRQQLYFCSAACRDKFRAKTA
jgi:YHS domain-containing protein